MSERQAGRELDAEVAEKVMGLVACGAWVQEWELGPFYWAERKCTVHAACYPADVSLRDQPTGFHATDTALPFFSTDIAAAWPVLEKMLARGYTASLDMDPDSVPYVMQFWDANDKMSHAVSKSLPLAICLAALAACAGKEG